MTRPASRPTTRARTLAACGPVVVPRQPPATGHQLRLADITAGEPPAYARLHKSLGPRLAPFLEAMRDDYLALGLPPDVAAEHAASHWTDDKSDRLRRYLRGSGPRAGRVTT
jgi:hypothetical protein